MKNFVKRHFCPTCLVSEIMGGPHFKQKCTNFGILGPKEAPGRSGNLKNGLGTAKNPYFDPLPDSLLFRGTKR